MDFIVFQRPNTIGITGNILTDPEHLSTLKVYYWNLVNSTFVIGNILCNYTIATSGIHS